MREIGIYTLEKNMDMRIGGRKIYYFSDQIRQVFITCRDLIETKSGKIVIQRLPDHQTMQVHLCNGLHTFID